MSWGAVAQQAGAGTDQGPELASLVRKGGAEPELVRVTDTIWMSQDVSNSYAISTPDGTIVVNAGTEAGGRRHRALYDAAGLAPYRYLVLTQSHTDHIGGLSSFAGTGAQVVAQSALPDVRGYWMRLSEFYTRRSGHLWDRVVGPRSLTHQREFVAQPDVLFTDRHTLEVGGRSIELLAVPGGETLDSLAVWLPDEKVAFVGNLLGPMYLHIPNLYTVRGDKIRSALQFLSSVQRVIDLDAEILVTGHGAPVLGAPRIRDDLSRTRDAVQFVHDATVAGMNQGKDVRTLMREIRLPEHLSMGEGHGKVSWAVHSIWVEYAGWFHFDSTTALYDVPVGSVAADLVTLAGRGPLVDRAAEHVDDGRPLQALHLLDIVTAAGDPGIGALRVKRSALEQLLEASGRANLSETMWLTAEIEDVTAALGKAEQ